MPTAEMTALLDSSGAKTTVAVANGPIVSATWIASAVSHHRR
jgi:hypothetical protein